MRSANRGLVRKDGGGGRDFGPSIRLARREVVKEFREDPDSPPGLAALIRGARVRDSLQTMEAARQITRAQWTAANRFRDDMAYAGGAQPGALDNAGVRSPMAGRAWPGDLQLDCLDRCRRVWAWLEARNLTLIVDHVVVWGGTLDAFASRQRCRRETATSLLQAGLNALVVFYDTTPEVRP